MSLAELGALAVQQRLIALRQAVDEAVRTRQFCRCHHLVVAGFETTIPDILHHRRGEQVRVLQYDRHCPTKLVPGYRSNIHPVDSDAAAPDIVKPWQQIDDRSLARAS